MKNKLDGAWTARFSCLQALFFAMYAGCSFLSYFLVKKGVSTMAIGYIYALVSLFSTVAQPLWGILCDKFKCHKIIYSISCILAPLIYLTIAKTTDLRVIVLCACMSGVFVNCMQNMANGWISELNSNGFSVNYSFARSFGSIAYALMSLAIGWIAARLGDSSIIVCMAVCAVGLIVIVTGLPRSDAGADPFVPKKPEKNKVSFRECAVILLHDREYLLVVLCVFLVMFALTGDSTFTTVLIMEKFGGGEFHVGAVSMIYALSEAVFMVLFTRLIRKVGFRRLFAVCLAAHALQGIAAALAPGLWTFLAAHMLQGLSYGLLVPCLQHYVATHIDARYSSTAQLVATSIGLSFSMFLGAVVSGWLSNFFTISNVVLYMSYIAVVATVIYTVYSMAKRREEWSAGVS